MFSITVLSSDAHTPTRNQRTSSVKIGHRSRSSAKRDHARNRSSLNLSSFPVYLISFFFLLPSPACLFSQSVQNRAKWKRHNPEGYLEEWGASLAHSLRTPSHEKSICDLQHFHGGGIRTSPAPLIGRYPIYTRQRRASWPRTRCIAALGESQITSRQLEWRTDGFSGWSKRRNRGYRQRICGSHSPAAQCKRIASSVWWVEFPVIGQMYRRHSQTQCSTQCVMIVNKSHIFSCCSLAFMFLWKLCEFHSGCISQSSIRPIGTEYVAPCLQPATETLPCASCLKLLHSIFHKVDDTNLRWQNNPPAVCWSKPRVVISPKCPLWHQKVFLFFFFLRMERF